MQRLRTLLLLTLFSAASCGEQRIETALRVDLQHPQWFACEPSGTRPKIEPEYQIDWSKVTTVPQAQAEVGKLVGVEHDREGKVAGYVLDLEGKHFVCVNNMQTQRDFYSKLPAPPQPGGMAANSSNSRPLRVVGPVSLPGAPQAILGFRS